MDATVTVYEYEKFDPQQKRWRKAETMATAAAIEREGGVMLRLTALVVDASRVDELGVLKPPSKRSTAGEEERDAS